MHPRERENAVFSRPSILPFLAWQVFYFLFLPLMCRSHGVRVERRALTRPRRWENGAEAPKEGTVSRSVNPDNGGSKNRI